MAEKAATSNKAFKIHDIFLSLEETNKKVFSQSIVAIEMKEKYRQV